MEGPTGIPMARSCALDPPRVSRLQYQCCAGPRLTTRPTPSRRQVSQRCLSERRLSGSMKAARYEADLVDRRDLVWKNHTSVRGKVLQSQITADLITPVD